MTKLEITGGNPKFNQEFKGQRTSYDVAVDPGTKSVKLAFGTTSGSTITVNGTEVKDANTKIDLTDGKASIDIKVTNGSNSKNYKVALREKSQDATLKELMVNESNGYGSSKAMSPEFNASTENYIVYSADSGRNFENLWPTSTDSNASVKVIALSGVDTARYDESDYNAKTGELSATSNSSGHARYAIYFGDQGTATLQIKVTSESGATKNYSIVITKKDNAADTLASVKTEAIKIINNYDLNDYRTTEKETLKEAINNLEETISNATKITDVTAAVEAFNETARDLKTDEDYIAELQQAKKSALDVISEAAKGTHDVGEQKQIDDIVSAATIQINAMTNTTDIAAVATKAKMDIEYAIMLNKAKAAAIAKVKAAAPGYNSNGQTSLDIIVNNAISEINEVKEVSNIDAIVAKAKLDINNLQGSSNTGAITYKTPGTPVLNASVNNEGNVVLSWNKTINTTSYSVYYKMTSEDGWTVKDTDNITLTLTGLRGGKSYEFKVVAHGLADNGAVISSQDSQISIVTIPETNEGVNIGKVSISKVKMSKGKVILSWKKVSGASGYQIYKSVKKASGFKKIKNTDALKYAVKNNIKKNKTYYFKVRAYKNVGDKTVYGSWSKTVKTRAK